MLSTSSFKIQADDSRAVLISVLLKYGAWVGRRSRMFGVRWYRPSSSSWFRLTRFTNDFRSKFGTPTTIWRLTSHISCSKDSVRRSHQICAVSEALPEPYSWNELIVKLSWHLNRGNLRWSEMHVFTKLAYGNHEVSPYCGFVRRFAVGPNLISVECVGRLAYEPRCEWVRQTYWLAEPSFQRGAQGSGYSSKITNRSLDSAVVV